MYTLTTVDLYWQITFVLFYGAFTVSHCIPSFQWYLTGTGSYLSLVFTASYNSCATQLQ